MRVGFSALNLCRPMTGVGRYLQALSKVKSEEFTSVAFTPNNEIQIDHSFDEIITSKVNGVVGKLLWSYGHPFFNNSPLDVYHSPQMFLPFGLKATKKIITVHDLFFLDMPSYYSKRETNILYRALANSASRADVIICISEYTKSRFLSYFPKYENIEVVYNSIDFSSFAQYKGKKNVGDAKKPFFLLPSNRTPRKNIGKTIQAYKNSEFYKAGFQLYICGAFDGNIQLNNDDLIHDLGYVSEEELSILYQEAHALLFFSLGEGFGYPIIEAAYHNTPVFAAANTSIIELFDYRKDLLCKDYENSEGITAFLDKCFYEKELTEEILQVLKKSFHRFSIENFSDNMLNIYRS